MTVDEVVFTLGKDNPEVWEAIAAIQIMQASGVRRVGVRCRDTSLCYLYHLAGLHLTDVEPTVQFKLDEAFRSIDSAMSHDMLYQSWLARVSGVDLSRGITPVAFPRMEPVANREHIAFCPFGLSKFQPIPLSAWKAVVRFLRTYGLPVYLVSDPGQRADGLNFTEGCTLSDAPIQEKLRILASAKLVVGMPNAWTWMAASWKRTMAIYYPTGIPPLRWFGFYNNPKHGRVEYLPHQIQIPVLLAGLRNLLTVLNHLE
jgi:hypothetical protein